MAKVQRGQLLLIGPHGLNACLWDVKIAKSITNHKRNTVEYFHIPQCLDDLYPKCQYLDVIIYFSVTTML